MLQFRHNSGAFIAMVLKFFKTLYSNEPKDKKICE